MQRGAFLNEAAKVSLFDLGQGPCQWNPSNPDTSGTEGSVAHISEVSLFQGLTLLFGAKNLLIFKFKGAGSHYSTSSVSGKECNKEHTALAPAGVVRSIHLSQLVCHTPPSTGVLVVQ